MVAALDEEGLPDEDILVSVCAGLVAVDRHGGVVRLVHYTAQEYFETAFADQMRRSRVDIAAVCVAYLSFDAVVGGDERAMRKLAFLEYAAQHWGEHARGEPETALRERIVGFCRDGRRIAAWYRLVHRRGHGFDVDAKASAKVTGLHVAAALGLAGIVEALLDEEMDVNATDIQGETPLHWAAAKGHEDVVKVLLRNGSIKPDVKSVVGRTPLSLAAESGHSAVVNLLAGRDGVDRNAKDSLMGETPLWRAADRGHDEVVKVLLAFGVDVNARDKYFDETPLSRAVDQGHKGVVEQILKRTDVDVVLGDKYFGYRPMERAKDGGDGEDVGMLEQYVRPGCGPAALGKLLEEQGTEKYEKLSNLCVVAH